MPIIIGYIITVPLLNFFFLFYLLSMTQSVTGDVAPQQFVELDFSVQEKVENLFSLSLKYSLSDVSLALEYAQRAVMEAEVSDDIDLQYRAYTNLGHLAFNAGLFEVAIKNYFKLLPIAEEMSDLKKISTANYTIGVIRLVLEDYEEAERYLQLGIKQMEKATSDDESINSNTRLIFANNMGVVFLGLERLSEAEEVIVNGLKMFDEFNVQNKSIRIQLLHNLADAYYRQGKHTESIETLKLAEEILGDGASMELLTSMVYLLWGSIVQDEGQMEEALKFYRKAFNYALQANGLSHLKHSATKLSEYYRVVNQPDSALIYANISDSYNTKQRLRQAGEELAKVELLSQFMEKEAQLKHEYRRSMSFFMSLMLIVLLIAVIVYVLYMQTKKRFRKTTREKDLLASSVDRIREESKQIKKELVGKEKDKTIHALHMLQNKEKVGEMIQMVTKNGKSSDQMISELRKSLNELNSLDKDQMWKEFELRFKGVHGEFNERLSQAYPTLTTNERRLSAFIKMDMTTKEIVSVTGQSIRAVEMARTRLRKKMSLTGTSANLNQHIQQI